MKTKFNLSVKRQIFSTTIAILAFTIFSLSGVEGLFSQTTVNATGGSQTINNNTFEYSIGEMAVVHTIQTANIRITHGVLQPKDGTLSVGENPLDFGLTVYPNPASDVLNLQPALSGGGTLDYILTDMLGRTVFKQTSVLHTGTEKQQIDISDFAAGTYLLYTTFTQNGKPHTKTFKIIKQSK